MEPFSIGQSQVSILKRYIARQKLHHQRVTFQDEYRKFLKLSRLQRSPCIKASVLGRCPAFCISRPWRGKNPAAVSFDQTVGVGAVGRSELTNRAPLFLCASR